MRLLIASDGPNITTGYGQIARQLAKYLMRAGGFEVAFASLQQMGDMTYVRVDGEYVPVYSLYGGQQPYLERVLSEFRADVLIHIRDPVVLVPHLFAGSYRLKPVAAKHGCKVIHWAPLMGEPPADVIRALTEDADFLLAPTQWAYEMYLFGGFPSNRMATVWWGVDTEVYYPEPHSKAEIGADPNRFLIGTVGVHDRREKFYPIILRAMSKLVKKYDVELFLHSGDGAFHFPHIAEQLGLRGRIIRPQIYIKDWGVPEPAMRALYNALDCYVTASGAEGFNMPVNEALCCRIPVVASAHPVHMEVMGNLALYAKAEPIVPNTFYFDYLTDPDDLAAKIETVIEGRWMIAEEEWRAYVDRIKWPSRVEELIAVFRRWKLL